MVQVNSGSMWISQKVMERVREMSQTQQRRNCLVRWTTDKRVRWYSMTATPFLTFYIAGLIFSADTLILVKFVLLGCLYGTAHTVGKTMFDDHLMTLLPLSVYMATKLWFYVTWLGYIAQAVPTSTTILFLASSLLLWYCFLKSWRGDPGIIRPTQEQRYRVHFKCQKFDWMYFHHKVFF